MTDELAAAFGGDPLPRVRAKLSPVLHEWLVQFIALSPLVIVASSDAAGRLDCSPRGGEPGFVTVLNERRLAIPERSGNRLLQTLRNIGEHPGVGLLFFVPGVNETARVNGSAHVVLSSDARWPELAHSLGPDDGAPAAAIVVDVEEAFYHCGRAGKLSRLWDVDVIAHHSAERPIPKRPALADRRPDLDPPASDPHHEEGRMTVE